jgi:hypothetical protein
MGCDQNSIEGMRRVFEAGWFWVYSALALLSRWGLVKVSDQGTEMIKSGRSSAAHTPTGENAAL